MSKRSNTKLRSIDVPVNMVRSFTENMNVPFSELPRIVVIGAGFAGVNFIKRLKKKPVQIVLIDQNNFHEFQPLLYRVAIAQIGINSVVEPIRNLIQGMKNVIFRMATVERIDSQNQVVVTNSGTLTYDYLVIATGSSTDYDGLKADPDSILSITDIRDALNIRSWVFQKLEEATLTTNIQRKNALSRFVIAGGGATGVEITGSLVEFRRSMQQIDYTEFTKQWMKIYLIESEDRLLPAFSSSKSAQTLEVLQNLGVKIMLGTSVKGFDGHYVILDNEEKICSDTLFWAGGVKGNHLEGIDLSELTAEKRLLVNRFNQLSDHDKIFAIGDAASMQTNEWPQGHPMIAQVAIQQGRQLATNLIHKIEFGILLNPFEYQNRGIRITIGKYNVITHDGKYGISGWMAHTFWTIMHLSWFFRIRNKIQACMNLVLSLLHNEHSNRWAFMRIRKSNQEAETGQPTSIYTISPEITT